MENYNDIINLLNGICITLGGGFDVNKVSVIDRGIPHSIEKLPQHSMAIYMFKYKDEYLKIGKVGSKSNARFSFQHYNPNSAISNLAKSIINDKELNNDNKLNGSNIKDWMLNNLQRIDIIMDEDLGIFVLDLFEACLHYKYKPKYEGFKTQTY